MRGFDDRDGLVEWLEKKVTRKAIVRALDEGTIEVLGGFSRIPPTPHSGWIVRVVSTYKKIWNLAILAADGKLEIRVMGEPIPWEFWDGEFSDSTLYTGDNPIKYKELKDAEKGKR